VSRTKGAQKKTRRGPLESRAGRRTITSKKKGQHEGIEQPEERKGTQDGRKKKLKCSRPGRATRADLGWGAKPKRKAPKGRRAGGRTRLSGGTYTQARGRGGEPRKTDLTKHLTNQEKETEKKMLKQPRKCTFRKRVIALRVGPRRRVAHGGITGIVGTIHKDVKSADGGGVDSHKSGRTTTKDQKGEEKPLKGKEK